MNVQVLSTILLILFGSGGVISAIIAAMKMRPDAQSAAVTQAQGTMEMAVKLNTELHREREEWRQRALGAEQALYECQRRHREARRDAR